MFTKPVKLAILCIIVIIVCFICSPGPSVSDVSGTYNRIYMGVSESLTLNTNGAFVQKVVYPDGASWSTNGKWQLINSAAILDSYYVFWDMEKNTLITPPNPVSYIAFEAKRRVLSREFEPDLQKVNKGE